LQNIANNHNYSGVVEIDESYFGARCIKGHSGCGAFEKTIVLGVFKRKGKIFTIIVPNCRRATLQAVIRGNLDPSSVTCRWQGRLCRPRRPWI